MTHVIQTANVLFEKLAGKQPLFTGKGRMMKYVILQPVDNGFLLFNTLTCELLFTDEVSIPLQTGALGQNGCLPEQELEVGKKTIEFLKSETLREKWFVVPEDFDEKRLVRQMRPIMQSFHQNKGITSYTILTTTDCNARCFYCYEKGFSRIAMTPDTAAKISAFIIEHAATASGKTFTLSEQKGQTHPLSKQMSQTSLLGGAGRILLKWFGGEPLYNLSVIDSICTDLRNANVPYSSSMTSNCYLFTPEIVEKAKSLWNLKHVQVTLDGTEDVYNRVKAYIKQPNGQTTKRPNDQTTKQLNDQTTNSPYQRVMRNIQLLLNAGIHVDIRMNLDKHNADNLMQLADELKDRFATTITSHLSSEASHLSAYSHVLFQNTTHVSKEEDYPVVNAFNDSLNEKLMHYGMLSLSPLPKEIPLHYCMADNENAVVFTPAGEMERCEHLTHADFTETEDDMELCDDCPFYPLCIRLKDCPEGTTCNEYIRSRHINIIRKKMIQAADRLHTNGKQQKKEVTPSSSAERKVGKPQFFPFLDKYVVIGSNNEIIHLNEIGKEILEMHVSGKTHKQIVEALLEEYDATECKISNIVDSFIVKVSQIIK